MVPGTEISLCALLHMGDLGISDMKYRFTGDTGLDVLQDDCKIYKDNPDKAKLWRRYAVLTLQALFAT